MGKKKLKEKKYWCRVRGVPEPGAARARIEIQEERRDGEGKGAMSLRAPGPGPGPGPGRRAHHIFFTCSRICHSCRVRSTTSTSLLK